MPQFIAKKDNYILGRYWAKGDICISDKIPSHHFESVQSEVSMPVNKPAYVGRPASPRVDVMAPEPSGTNEPEALSQMRRMPRRRSGGMIAGAEPKIMTHRTLKVAK